MACRSAITLAERKVDKMQNLIQFGSNTSVVKKETTNAKGEVTAVSVRLQSAREYKDAHGLKGQVGKRAYNAYLAENGKANTAAFAAAMSTGQILIKGFKKTRVGGSVTFVDAATVAPEIAADELARIKAEVRKEIMAEQARERAEIAAAEAEEAKVLAAMDAQESKELVPVEA